MKCTDLFRFKSMNSHLDASKKFCNSCPFSRFGLCPTLIQELSELRGLNRGYTIPFPLLQQDIADTVGLTTINYNNDIRRLILRRAPTLLA